MEQRERRAAVLVGVGVIIAFVDGYMMPPSNLFERATIGAAVGSQMLPVAAVATLAPPLPRPRYWIGVWFLVAILTDFIQLALSRVPGTSNLWFVNGAQVFEDSILLWALSFWQIKPILRLSFRIGIPLLVVVVLTIALMAGELTTFQSFTSPFRGLVMISAFAYTLIANLQRDSDHALSRDWMWVSIGFMMFFSTQLIVHPVVASLIVDNMELARLVLNIKAILDVIAFVLVARGLLCPIPARSSGRI